MFEDELDKWLNKELDAMKRKLEAKIEVACLAVEGKAKANLKPRTSTQRLIRSMSHKVIRRGFDSMGRVGTNVEYAVYVEKGTKPHFPPVDALARWAKQRGVNPYVIARSISIKGTKPHPFLIPAGEDILRGFDWSL